MAIYNIKESPLFKVENVSSAINEIVSKMQVGDQAYLPYGQYQIQDTIHIINENELRYCHIDLYGEYEYCGNATAVIIEGEHLDFSLQRITTNRRSDFYKTTPDDILPTGVEVRSCNYSRLDFDEIEGFEYGLKLSPNRDDTGICYTKFNFRYISYCYIPLFFGVPDDVVAWINENQFNGGRLKGYYGMVARKGKRQIDEYNNNTFYNIAFEAIETNAIDWEFCTFNTIISPRFESVMCKTICESETCKSNKYRISVAIPFDSVDIQSKYTDLQAPLHTYWEHMIREIRTDSEGNKSYEFFKELCVTVENQDTELPMNCKNLVIRAEKVPVTVKLHQISAFENNMIRVVVQASAYPIRIVDHTGKTVYSSSHGENINTLFFANGHWMRQKPENLTAVFAG